jgi:hypothetical protein
MKDGGYLGRKQERTVLIGLMMTPGIEKIKSLNCLELKILQSTFKTEVYRICKRGWTHPSCLPPLYDALRHLGTCDIC